MRIVLQTWGSDGDVRPLVALAAGLKAAGHVPTLVVTSVDDKDYRPLCTTLGVDLRMVPERIGTDLPAIVRRMGNVKNPLRLLRGLFEAGYYPFVDAIYRTVQECCEDSDIAIGHFVAFPLRAAALQAGVPYVSVMLWPGMVPTATRPPLLMPSLGSPVNRGLWWVFRRLFHHGVGRGWNGFWTRWGLPPIRSVVDDVMRSDRLNLLAASPTLWPVAPDWDERVRVSGFLAMPEHGESWQPPAQLRAFLDAGPPPVFLTLGSSQQIDPEPSATLLVEAARRARCRALIQMQGTAVAADTVDGDLYFRGRAPHATLFPRCAAVVHHGGAGTTHAAVRAGVPSVTVAFVSEQRTWGRQLQRCGVALAPLSYRTATPDTLAAYIVRTVADTGLHQRAVEVAARLRAEDGVAEAVRLIEQAGR